MSLYTRQLLIKQLALGFEQFLLKSSLFKKDLNCGTCSISTDCGTCNFNLDTFKLSV